MGHLLSKVADINLCDDNRYSPLHVACFNERGSIVDILLDIGADINLCEKIALSLKLVKTGIIAL